MTLATVRGDFALAVMRGVVYQIREILESMDSGNGTKRLVLFGGGAKTQSIVMRSKSGTVRRIKTTFRAIGRFNNP